MDHVQRERRWRSVRHKGRAKAFASRTTGGMAFVPMLQAFAPTQRNVPVAYRATWRPGARRPRTTQLLEPAELSAGRAGHSGTSMTRDRCWQSIFPTTPLGSTTR